MKASGFVFVLLISTSISLDLEINADCITPNNEIAKCISFASCSVILKELEDTATDEVKQFALRSQCGYDQEANVPLVCCGSTGKDMADLGMRTNFDPDADLEYSQLFTDPTSCGLEREMPRITGGDVAELYEFPWLVALEYESKYSKANLGILCGGSLINKNYVLTAAHCVLHLDLVLVRVWLGDWNITSHPKDCRILDTNGKEECNDEVLKIGVKDKIGHPFFSRNPFKDDIALVRLEQEVEFTEFIRPICLPSANQQLPPFGTLLTVAGWGATENSTSTGSDVKMKVQLPLARNDQCTSKRLSITENDLCVGGLAGKDSCRGDSGGPIMRFRAHANQLPQWYLEGVVSHGIGCGKLGYPAVYTQASKYMHWIKNVLKHHQEYQPCTTPNREPAYCIPFSKCKVIYDGVTKGLSAVIEFAKKSQCGSIVNPEPYVCCGSIGETTDSVVSTRIAENVGKLEPTVLFPDDRK